VNEGEQYPDLAPTPGYRYADEVAGHLFVAGQVPLDPGSKLVGPGDPRAQARQCLDNLFRIVSHHGFEVGDIHRLTVYVVGEHRNLLDAWAAVTEWFAGPVPPATLLGVAALGYEEQLVEVDAQITRG
jgi:enamine deaminase RidA (YjgF/YER057c/UK114 family)